MRTLASKTRGRHAKAMELLREAVGRRNEGGWSVATVTDVLAAANEAGAGLANLADAAWGELPEEKAATNLFGGGLAEAAQQALEEEGVSADTYEHAGKFHIGTHFRKDGA